MKNILSFIDDEEKMADFKVLSKDEFLFSYSYLTEEEYDATFKEVTECQTEYQENLIV